MAEETPKAGSEAATTPTEPVAGEQPQARTVEQVEADEQAKRSALGRQHAATEQTLRTRVAALEAEQKASGDRTEAESDAIKNENEQLRKQLSTQDTQYAVDLRTTKFPLSAEALTPEVLGTMDEAKLAGLEARLAPAPEGATTPAPRVDPSTAPKVIEASKPLSEKTVEELEADLERQAPEYMRSIQR